MDEIRKGHLKSYRLHYGIIFFIKKCEAAIANPNPLFVREYSIDVNIRMNRNGSLSVADFRDLQWPSAAFLNWIMDCCRMIKGTVFVAAISCKAWKVPNISSICLRRLLDS